MISKVIFATSIALLICLNFADRQNCPDPSAAKTLAHTEEVHEKAPDFGRIEKVVTAATPEGSVSCITITGFASAGTSGSISIASLGISKDTTIVKIVSDIKQGIDAAVEIYTT